VDPSRKLKLDEGVFYAKRGGKHLFLQPSAPDWLVVNRNGAILLSCCDGTATLEKIIASGSSIGSLLPQAEALFSEALGRGILVDTSFTQQRDPGTMLAGNQRRSKPVLGSVYLKLTNQCDLHCNYCYAQSGKPSDVLSFGDLDST
jgi:sulfatase maturation enzyme AslB (radical SAM superfamily)